MMTNDLVQRLRSGCKNIQLCRVDACCCPVMEEAADYIEELEEQLAKAEYEIQCCYEDLAGDSI